ncbi:MAG: hypothetical protein AB1449_09400 [Chloroflexota bacterium]
MSLDRHRRDRAFGCRDDGLLDVAAQDVVHRVDAGNRRLEIVVDVHAALIAGGQLSVQEFRDGSVAPEMDEHARLGDHLFRLAAGRNPNSFHVVLAHYLPSDAAG